VTDDDEGRPAVDLGWTWDPSLYAGSAEHYAAGRVPYPAALVTALVEALHLDGTGRLLDVGCGPGSLTLLLAPHVAEATGLDADADMLATAARLAREQGLTNTVWRHLRAEELPADLSPVDVVVLAQSFHWTDRDRVAAAARGLLAPGGAVVHVHARTHRGVDDAQTGAGSSPRPPWPAIDELIRRYLGSRPRAGQSVLPGRIGGGDEDRVYRGAGFTGPQRLTVTGREVERSAEQILAAVHSLSYAAPHLFGPRLTEFDADLRHLLHAGAEEGRFSERMGDIAVDIWR
jgi:SAM-dependent methyltransferase